jgi:hypothetical protein
MYKGAIMEQVVLERNSEGVIQACLQQDAETKSLCVQLTSETNESSWPVIEEQEMYLPYEAMDRLVAWWQDIRGSVTHK